ncbi:MAG TPA: tetratricopeptide repeat protein [Kiritimatiellia bacterium]|nr:tetratricopeptide repeat protein [Kiritimatiellia bacterium]HRZ11801.1 tetratricopeptide repeat protein [Kiritimatiellia bacterium]HSA17393.1 tetratricopeptide repeat protein [Kiritimatiellia bacterium]
MNSRDSRRIILPVLLLAAAGLRLLYFGEIRGRADFIHPGLDAGYHDYWARGIAFDRWTPPPDQPDPLIRQLPYFRPPGYPYFLSAIYRLIGAAPAPARLVQFALGVLNVFLAFWFTRRWFGEAAGLIAAALAGTYWVFIYYEGELLEPVLLITLTWLALLALGQWTADGRPAWLLGAGLALGASALARPNALAWLPAVALWLAWRIGDWKKAARPAGLLVAGTLLAVLPVTARNYIVARDVVLISSNGGINLLLGQDPEAVADHASSETGNWSCFDYPALLAKASAKAGRPLKASEASRWFARKARQQIIGRPGVTARLLALKTLLFWGPREVSNNKIEELERAASPVLRRLPLSFSFVLAWGLVGGALTWRKRRDTLPVAALLLLLIAAYFLSFLPFIAAGQYRAPLTPLLMVFAAVGLVETGRLAAGSKPVEAVAGLAAALALWFVIGINYTGYCPSEARWHLGRAISLERAGDLAASETAYREVLRAKPDLALAHNRLGVILAKQDRTAEALKCFEAAVAADPALTDARFNLGLALALQNRLAEAIPEFEAVLRIQPDHADARHNLEQARRLLGSPKANEP